MTRVGQFLARLALAASMLTLVAGAPVYADCFEDIGCTDSDWFDVDDLVELSCENLWHVRNRIYDENGFCFKTKRARNAFDNAGCWVWNQADVKLSTVERHNVNEIVEAELENGC